MIKARVAELREGPKIDEKSLEVNLESLGPLENFVSTLCSILLFPVIPVFCGICIKEVG